LRPPPRKPNVAGFASDNGCVRWLRQHPLRSVMLRLLRVLKPVVAVPFGSFRIAINLRDSHIGPELFVSRTWEPHLVRYIPLMKLEGRIAFDIGAHVGIYSLPLSRAVGPAGRVVALEPECENFELLSRNIEANRVTNVTALQAAAGETERDCFLRIDRENRGNHRIVPQAMAGVESQCCAMTTIDRLASSFRDDSVGYIKIDVQGAEARVLEGMRETIARNPRMILQIEIELGDPATAVATVETLRMLGFDGFEVRPEAIRSLALAERDIATRRVDYTDLLLSRDPARLAALSADFR
jgi:FkbM family methyltransferase